MGCGCGVQLAQPKHFLNHLHLSGLVCFSHHAAQGKGVGGAGISGGGMGEGGERIGGGLGGVATLSGGGAVEKHSVQPRQPGHPHLSDHRWELKGQWRMQGCEPSASRTSLGTGPSSSPS